MRKWFKFAPVALLIAAAAAPAMAAQPATPGWPSIDKQLKKDHVRPGTALEALVYENQDFGMLFPEEANDTIPVPAWLRVWFRKGHPELTYDREDPTKGYPRVLHEVYEWMVSHQELRPTMADVEAAPDGDIGDMDVIAGAATVGTNVRTSGAQTSPRSESDIRINYWNPNLVVAASNNISASGQQAQFYSSDGGATWGQTFLPLGTDSYHSDPTVDWTSNGTAWSTSIGIKGNILKMRAFKSTNNGVTWTSDATFSGTQKSTDKQIMWADHSATSPYKDTIYVCWHNGTPLYVNRRTAAGWGATPIQVSGAESSGTAIGCDVRTNLAGDAFVFWPTTTNRRIVVAKSTNGGASWGAGKVIATTFDGYDIGIPSFNNRRALIYVSGGAYGSNVYATWVDLTGETGCTSATNEPGSNAASSCKTRVWFARSTDGGTTWGAPVMINNQASKNDQFNQWFVVDETTGRIGVMYYDTVNDATRKKTDVYFQSSSDGGVTWSAATKVSTAMTDETVAGADSGNQYGDYNSLSAYAGKFFPSWTDRRNNAKEEIWTAPVQEP
ncbi:MAG TPA: sialidase family protein [Thermoanaerobaculia bacterium]|nr:sialidase family protein [Thermoanaerobaculia bacterium]